MEEVEDVVTLIAKRGRQVVGSVALDVVVLDMMVEVAVPGMAHERIEHVGEGVVEPGHVLGQDTSHVDVLVHHEGVGADIAELQDQVQDAVKPCEGVEEVEDAGDGGGEVEEEMGDNEHVGLYTHEGACDADVERDDPGIEERGNGDLVRVYGRDDGGLKASILGVVEAIEGVDDGLIVKASLGSFRRVIGGGRVLACGPDVGREVLQNEAISLGQGWVIDNVFHRGEMGDGESGYWLIRVVTLSAGRR